MMKAITLGHIRVYLIPVFFSLGVNTDEVAADL